MKSELAAAIKNPRGLWVHALQEYYRFRGHEGIRVMDQDWDNLVVLDACRYDLFEDIFPYDKALRAVSSAGSNTAEFIEKNFPEDSYLDTVYISANPQITRTGANERFYTTFDLWKTDWDEELKTVLPRTVAETALEAEQRYPEKRLIIHFLQPHYPFIGETGRQIEHGTLTGNGLIEETRGYANIWKLLEAGDIDRETVVRAYRENLELVVPHVQRLTGELSGKTVITADHGNSFGRLGVYGHPAGCYMPELVRVPWVELETTERKTVTKADGKIQSEDSEETSDISARLEALGYVEE